MNRARFLSIIVLWMIGLTLCETALCKNKVIKVVVIEHGLKKAEADQIKTKQDTTPNPFEKRGKTKKEKASNNSKTQKTDKPNDLLDNKQDNSVPKDQDKGESDTKKGIANEAKDENKIKNEKPDPLSKSQPKADTKTDSAAGPMQTTDGQSRFKFKQRYTNPVPQNQSHGLGANDTEIPGVSLVNLEFYDLNSKLPIGQSALLYLKRLLEYFVSHQKGYVASDENPDETITVELYPLKEGWTAFARYSQNGREERVDQLFPSELSQFSERVVLALLGDVSISSTINRENVLLSDSKKSVQRIKGSSHFVLAVGTQIKGGLIDTVITNSDDGEVGTVERKPRVFFPVKMHLGYRGRYENWGLETMVHLGIGTGKVGIRHNDEGGHIDYGGDTGLCLHFLNYLNPRGLTSFYLGAGTTFNLVWFSAIKAIENRSGDDRSTIVSGGLDVDAVFGWEFMRASSVHLYLQGELNAPMYFVRNEDKSGEINTWLPGVSLNMGLIF